MTSQAVGVLHPGEMGVTVGASARAGGARVLWASEGRSAQTRERASAAGLEDARTLASVCASSGVILSVCPPHSALDLARRIAPSIMLPSEYRRAIHDVTFRSLWRQPS